MQSKEFDIQTYRGEMATLLGGTGGSGRVFFDALEFAEEAHAGQLRRSGDPYILHPCSVARILAEEMDVRNPQILAAALLHDTVEDVDEVTIEVIGERFGRNVEAIVDGCTKIIQFTGDKQTFYKLVHRKIFSGAATRLEVMLVKMADRLHNLRTLDAMPRDRRQKVADETLDIYAPMAKVMGLFDLKRELYDLALKYKFPRQSHKVLAHIRRLEQDSAVREIADHLRNEMEKVWLGGEITPRAKGLWGYYDPVNRVLSRSIEQPLEFIIVVHDIQNCYRVLGLVNQNYPPIPRTIRDFIANPKPTGYQGLHARANIKGQNYLFKIRTTEMARRAQKGILGARPSDRELRQELEKGLKEMFDILGTEEGLSAREMIAASGKKEIYTFTPKGDRICLPKQSIVLDFAFQVHTEIGNRCIGAMVGRQRVGPEHVLQDGDRVRIMRQKEPVLFDPSLQELCQTPRARSGLAKGFRHRRQSLAVAIGRDVVEQELHRVGIETNVFRGVELSDILEHFAISNLEELYNDVGMGRILLAELVEGICREPGISCSLKPPAAGELNRIILTSLDPAVIKFSACCKPVPTQEDLIGLLSERGLSVHRQQCERYRSLKVKRKDVVRLQWRLGDTAVSKPQHLFIEEATRNRILMLLAAAPEKMAVSEVISLTGAASRKPAWEISFEVDNLDILKKVLHHFSKAALPYEFGIEQ